MDMSHMCVCVCVCVGVCVWICLPMQETQKKKVWSRGQENLLEEEMATHSNVLAWRIPGTGGGLLSMGSHRVGHDWSDLAAAAAAAWHNNKLNTQMLSVAGPQMEGLLVNQPV